VLLHAYSVRDAIERGFVEYDSCAVMNPIFVRLQRAEIFSILLKTRSGSNLRGRIDPRYIPGVTGPLLQRSASCSTESNRLHSTCIEPVTEEEQPAARTGDEASG
jgi:hypothetical protein